MGPRVQAHPQGRDVDRRRAVHANARAGGVFALLVTDDHDDGRLHGLEIARELGAARPQDGGARAGLARGKGLARTVEATVAPGDLPLLVGGDARVLFVCPCVKRDHQRHRRDGKRKAHFEPRSSGTSQADGFEVLDAFRVDHVRRVAALGVRRVILRRRHGLRCRAGGDLVPDRDHSGGGGCDGHGRRGGRRGGRGQ